MRGDLHNAVYSLGSHYLLITYYVFFLTMQSVVKYDLFYLSSLWVSLNLLHFVAFCDRCCLPGDLQPFFSVV